MAAPVCASKNVLSQRELRTLARRGLPDDHSNVRETRKRRPLSALGSRLRFVSGRSLRRRVRFPNLPAGACRDSDRANQSRPGDARQCPQPPCSLRPTPPRRGANAALARSVAMAMRFPNSPSRPEFGATIAHRERAGDSRGSSRPVPAVFLPVDDGWDDAGRVETRPCAVRAVYLSDKRIHLRPGRSRRAGASRRAPYFDGLRAMAKTLLEQKRHVIMFVGDQATLVMPDETLSLGKMTANDNFRIEPAFGPNGPTWRATKI